MYNGLMQNDTRQQSKFAQYIHTENSWHKYVTAGQIFHWNASHVHEWLKSVNKSKTNYNFSAGALGISRKTARRAGDISKQLLGHHGGGGRNAHSKTRHNCVRYEPAVKIGGKILEEGQI